MGRSHGFCLRGFFFVKVLLLCFCACVFVYVLFLNLLLFLGGGGGGPDTLFAGATNSESYRCTFILS